MNKDITLENKMNQLEEKIQEIRDNLNNIDDVLDYFDDLVYEDESTSIKDLDNLIRKLKIDNLYTPELEKFIEQYLKYYNE